MNKKSIIGIIIVFVLASGGYAVKQRIFNSVTNPISNFVGNQVAEKTLEQMMGGKGVDVDIQENGGKITTKEGSVEYSEQGKWPTDLPKDVPSFQSGKVGEVMKWDDQNTTNWSISLTDLKKENFEQYKNELKKNNFKMEEGIIGLYMAEGKKGNLQVNVSFDETAKIGGLNVIVDKQYQEEAKTEEEPAVNEEESTSDEGEVADEEKTTESTEDAEETPEDSAINYTEGIWPTDLSSDVPEFKYGKIGQAYISDSDTEKSWTIGFAEVEKDAFSNYSQQLKEKGWQIDTTITSVTMENITATKDTLELTMILLPEEKSGTIAVTEKK